MIILVHKILSKFHSKRLYHFFETRCTCTSMVSVLYRKFQKMQDYKLVMYICTYNTGFSPVFSTMIVPVDKISLKFLILSSEDTAVIEAVFYC